MLDVNDNFNYYKYGWMKESEQASVSNYVAFGAIIGLSISCIYFFAGTKEMEKFKKQPSKYMIVQAQGASLPIQPPAPKFMITGTKCAGVTTQINMLCEKFKLDPLELEDAFNKKQADELKARQRQRLL